MKRLLAGLLFVVGGAALVAAQARSPKALDIWVVDVEGGKAALYVTPTGQTALIDTGFPGARDLDRFMAAIADCGRETDRLPSFHALPRGSHRQPRRAGEANSGWDLRRSRSDRRGTRRETDRAGAGRTHDHETAGAGRRLSSRVCRAVQQSEAHRRETWRPPADHRCRVAHRDVSRQRPEDAAAAGRRQAESGLRQLHADGGHDRHGRP